MPFLIAAIILLGFPAAEIFVTWQVADQIGWWLLLWLIVAALVGRQLIQEEKMALFGRLFSSLQSGQPVGFAMLDSLRTLLAGVLLIVPGVLSDILAVGLLILPSPKRSAPTPDNGIIEGEWHREGDTPPELSDGPASDRSRPRR